ncbi:hypothetical protein Neosp_001599 [[Neocosmospora] mangrovei]
MLSSVALWALLATTSHAAYVQSRDCSTDTAGFRLIPEGLRASVNASRDTFNTDFHLVANYFNGTECNSTSTLDVVPVFTVVDYNGVHQYPGRIVNTSCAKYGPLAARLRLEITSTFNRSTFLDAFEITIDLEKHDGTPLLCVEANLTPEVRPWTQLVSFWLPVLVFSVASLVASWPLQQNEHHAIFQDAQDRNNHRMTRAAEMLAYIQFIYFSGALSLRYPGFLQPLIGFTSWSTLMLPAGPVSNQSRYVGVRDGIYETNGTLTGAPGFVILSQITSSPGMSKNWFNTIAFALIVLLFFFVAIHVREVLREQSSPNTTNTKSQEPLSRFKERSWAVSRLFLSLFLLPLSAWSTYQLSNRRMVLQNSAVAIVALVLLLSSFWWTWMQANSSADIGLFVIPGETRVRGKKSKEQRPARARTSALDMHSVLEWSYFFVFAFGRVTDLPSKILLGYIILSWHLAILVGIFLVPIFLDLAHRGLEGWIAKAGATEAEKAAPGCRSIEVDCWDGRDGQPIVKHGYSLTASIGFQDVIDAISQYAFVASDFPLWISLEVHCSPRQKSIMAQTMRDTFGSKLVTEPLSDISGPLPSPSQLRGRILIKAKVAKGVEPSREARVSDDIPASTRSSQDHGNLTEAESTDSASTISSSAISQEASSQVSQPQPSVNGPLEELAVYGPGKRLPRPSKVDATGNFVYSVSEANFKSYLKHKDGGSSLGFLNTRHMVRVYPDASRIDSSNLSPLQYWRHGVQMAALNYQTSDLNMGLNQAMFHGGTDNSGYVLKPERLRQPLELTRDNVQELRFSVDVLMTKDLCWPETASNNASVCVQIKLLVADAHKEDASQTKRRTKSIPLQRHDVILDSRLDFDVKTQYPSLVFLKWSVKLSPDTQGYPRQSTLASGMAKLENLKQGYRLLPLKKSFQDEQDCGYLVCKVQKCFWEQDGAGSKGVGK